MDSGTVVLLTREGMGSAPVELQLKLLGIYLRLLLENGALPSVICFYADGVKLTVEGSLVLEPLQALAAKNVRLIICRTCLDYFGLLEQVHVGIVGGMPDILEAQARADKVITL